MVGHQMDLHIFEKSHHVSTISVDTMKEDLAHNLSQKYPGVPVVSIAQCVVANGVSYRNGMVIVHGSAGGMPEFVEITQMCIIKDELAFIVKQKKSYSTSWYHKHFWAFELVPTRQVWIISHSELKDPHPLADYKVGPLQMVTRKNYSL